MSYYINRFSNILSGKQNERAWRCKSNRLHMCEASGERNQMSPEGMIPTNAVLSLRYSIDKPVARVGVYLNTGKEIYWKENNRVVAK